MTSTSPSQRASDEELLHQAVARLRASIMAIVFGLTAGTGLFIATAWLLIKGGPVVGPHLGLLGNYLPYYSVTWPGAFLGFVEAAIGGALVGYAIAFIYNRLVDLRRG
jgi:hypothetical protein